MYRKVLIPLDGSRESEGVFAAVKGELAPDAEVTLLRVIFPGQTRVLGGHVLPATQIEEAERSEAMSYLRDVARRMEGGSYQCRCEVTLARSVSRGIVDFARHEGVDLIAMYTHDRKGLAGLIQKSIAKDVLRKAPVEVKVFKPRELALVG